MTLDKNERRIVETLHKHKSEVDADTLWESIEQQLPKKRNRFAPLFIPFIFGLFLGGLGVLLTYQNILKNERQSWEKQYTDITLKYNDCKQNIQNISVQNSEHVFDEIVAKPQKQNMSGLVRSINHEIETTKTEIFNDAQAFVLDLGTYSSETSAAEPVEKMGSAYALESLLDENVKQDSKIENTPFQSVGRLKMPDVIFEPVVNLYPNYTPIQPVSNARYSIGFNVKSGISFTKDRNIVSENSDRTFFSPQPLESMLISIALRRKLHPSWSVGIGGQYVGLVSRVNVNNIEKIFENEPAVVAYLYQSNGNITSTQGQSIKTTIRTTHGNVYNYDISWEATASLGWHSKVKSWNCDVYSTIGFPLFQSHKGSSLLGEKYSIYQPRTVDFDKNFSIQVSSNVSRDWRFGRLGLGIGMYYRSSHFWLDQQALTRTWISPMMGISYQYKLY